MQTEKEKIHHLECLAIRFIERGYENHKLICRINKLPDELKTIILSEFVCTQLKTNSHHHINKHELYSMSDKNNRKFTKNFKSIVGRSMVCSELETISNILLNSYFNETHYDLSTVFNSQLGFEPTTYYIKQLRDLFPTNKLFRVISIDHLSFF